MYRNTLEQCSVYIVRYPDSNLSAFYYTAKYRDPLARKAKTLRCSKERIPRCSRRAGELCVAKTDAVYVSARTHRKLMASLPCNPIVKYITNI